MPITKSEVEQILEPWYETFWISVINAFRQYFKTHENELSAIFERTKSSYINDIIVDNLRQLMADAPPNRNWESKFGTKRLWFERVLCMRIKKVRRNLRPQNYYSQAAFSFYTHSIEPPVEIRFPNMPAPTCLFLAYTANKTNTFPESLYIICPKTIKKDGKNEVEWILPIPKPDKVVIIANQIAAEKEETPPRRVIAKQGIRK